MAEVTSTNSKPVQHSPSKSHNQPPLTALPVSLPVLPPSSLKPSRQSHPSDGTDANNASQNLGRRSRFSNEEYLILIREVEAAKSNIFWNGEIRVRFGIVAFN